MKSLKFNPMRSLKFILAVGFLLVYSLGVAFGQASNKNKQVKSESFNASGILPCAKELVSGYENLVYTYWDNKTQLRASGTFVGISGKVYEWSQVLNYTFKDYVPGKAFQSSEQVNATIWCEGEALAVMKLLFHYTVNANGEFTASIDKGTWDYECL